jgi:hypothetical protein
MVNCLLVIVFYLSFLYLQCSARDDEQVAAALGYTVHLLLLASKYLEVSVPTHFFTIVFTFVLSCKSARASEYLF